MAWSAEQVSALQAMGLTPYALAGAVSHAPVAEPAAASDRLAQALLRAARGGDVRALLGDLESVRRDPARKRELWPALRSLRRTR